MPRVLLNAFRAALQFRDVPATTTRRAETTFTLLFRKRYLCTRARRPSWLSVFERNSRANVNVEFSSMNSLANSPSALVSVSLSLSLSLRKKKSAISTYVSKILVFLSASAMRLLLLVASSYSIEERNWLEKGLRRLAPSKIFVHSRLSSRPYRSSYLDLSLRIRERDFL